MSQPISANATERRTELISIIEGAFLHFTDNVFNADGQLNPVFSMRRTLQQHNSINNKRANIQPVVADDFLSENDDWESETDQMNSNLANVNETNDSGNLNANIGPELLGTRLWHLVAFRLRALAQIYKLLLENRHATKRDLFYESKSLYQNQGNFDRALSAICKFLNASRKELHVVSCSKGFAIGELFLQNAMDESEVDFHCAPIALNEALTEFDFVQSEAKFLLIVEKDSVFQRLLDEQWTERYPKSILLTGRGYPDICTRRFLAWLSTHLPQMSMMALMDADPYGIEIFLTYKFGSERTRIESGDIQLPHLQWIGFLPSDAQRLAIPRNQILTLNSADKRRINKIAERALAHNEQEIFDELAILLNTNCKLEIEALCSISAQFLSTIYLNYKLQAYQ